MTSRLEQVLKRHQEHFFKVVSVDPGEDKLCHLDFTAGNDELAEIDIADTDQLSSYIIGKLKAANAVFGIGGYKENRILYKRSQLFNRNDNAERSALGQNHAESVNRSVHLGIDIWGPAGTEVFLPLEGSVHSFAYNGNFGDYGATIIFAHQLEDMIFHTLYGHLSLPDLAEFQKGTYYNKGARIAHFGEPHENGNWPPHLHFQVIANMDDNVGDYPGVCSLEETGFYFGNCPDADLILQLMQYT